MPNFLLLLSLLTILLTTCTPASSLNTTIGPLHTFGACWTGSKAPVTYRDCLDVIRNQLGRPYDPDETLTFSLQRSATIIIPYAKVSKHGNCNIVLGIKGDRLAVVEKDTFRNVIGVALDVAVKCIIRPPHLGGFGWAGEGGKLFVSIIGSETGVLKED
ncbi:MAG: hypothetical protein LQ343_007489 [Gyalolechia ehrenbergii]|nr:MAG: hypothetical protein LQ343_007489 [Gyalolechia ehrenbergii]